MYLWQAEVGSLALIGEITTFKIDFNTFKIAFERKAENLLMLVLLFLSASKKMLFNYLFSFNRNFIQIEFTFG